MNLRFDGRVVAVTGAGHGIGQAIARAFLEGGARVHAADLNPITLRGVEAARLDLTDRDAAARWIQGIGAIDVLVHCAGGVAGQAGQPLEDVTDQQWDAIVAINMTAAFTLARAAAPGMKARGQGRIITISSGAGITVSKTGIQAYAAAKAGEIGLTRQLAHELGRHGITVNSVAPGFILSNPATLKQWAAYGEAGQRALVDGIALRRLGTPEDIAHAVLFLASDFAAYINGQIISVDGGK